MKKIICLASLLLCFSLASMAQSATKVNQVEGVKTKSCTPMSPEECAKKMGLSLDEYLKLPKKACKSGSTASAAMDANSAIPVVKTSNVAKTEKKCCGSMEECAKKMGMTVEECKKLCPAGDKVKTSQAAVETKAKTLIATKDDE